MILTEPAGTRTAPDKDTGTRTGTGTGTGMVTPRAMLPCQDTIGRLRWASH